MGEVKEEKRRGRCVIIVVGEASGDLHAANLVRSMKKKDPSLFFFGIGGKAMREAGVRILMEAGEVTAVGVTESLAKLPVILKGMALVKNLLKNLKPDLVILVDFPDFNLRVAPTAKKLGIPVLYYISPQLWAWRQGRAAKLKELVDHLAVILPFEEAFYKKWNIPVTFVGHPLLDAEEERGETAKDPETRRHRTVGILPGSREREVERHLPIMLEAAGILKARHPDLEFVVSAAHTVGKIRVERILRRSGSNIPCELSEANVQKIFQRVELVMATSGTVTLEAALFGVPCVILYRVSPISFWVGRMLIKVPHIGLANLIAGKEIQPELIQKEATPQTLAERCHRMLTDTDYKDQIIKECNRLRSLLGGRGASDRAADIAFRLMESNNPQVA
ncbi:MAG: lipid-A-disaccharide synthase [Desulfobacterales bacterium CG07_land_8_20_14_0_80_52_14]|nr:MAG: lipid-A-disaccharide synthase [Desulfobacterales bacterium CG23_combo_of_CG06-09_8_20_14_all_52_9]PIU49330.1 MAG: lipid-A-disaccharide synthase [Desulfobacterales bacterium CG07_land_8_20_14_0_80_52_14]